MNHAETAGPNLIQHCSKLDDLPLPRKEESLPLIKEKFIFHKSLFFLIIFY